MSVPPSDSEILESLPWPGASIEDRHPYSYATSAPLDLVLVRLSDGAHKALILKDLEPENLIGNAADSKPGVVHDPRREVETYRRILLPRDLGPPLVASRCGEAGTRGWLLIEKAAGVELWQVGALETWRGVARWLGGMHAAFASYAEELHAANSLLIRHDADWYSLWAERARSALARSPDPRACGLLTALEGYDSIICDLASFPRTFLHGEFYPSNVLVDAGSMPLRVQPVDWEMSAIGPGPIDLAALTAGWGEEESARLLEAYRRGLVDAGGAAEVGAVDLDRCRLHMALQWIGWSAAWRPPAEHATDWVGEASAAATRLGLG